MIGVPAGERGQGVPRVEMQFDLPHRQHEPRGELGVRYRIEGCEGETIRAVEHSVLWYTEGKGEEDLGVHFFQRIADRGLLPPTATSGAFSTPLPQSPLSYEGVIVKVRWCVRVRIFFEGGRDFVSEHVFTLGRIPPGRPPGPQPAAEVRR
ncbi:MAG: hypothetical protein EBX36_01125 [Planctomycetia bacterium]|nr:hypothetical protein [Planctomycetia bacterium]